MARSGMKWRSFRPGIDGDPERDEPRFFETGSTFEPAHRQLVEVDFGHVVLPCRYNRKRQLFSVRFDPGDYMETEQPVKRWRMFPPEPREGLTADEVDGL